MTLEFPQHNIGIVHGIDKTYFVNWVAADVAYLTDESDDVVYEFSSVRSGGFINVEDVIDQASDAVAEWDSEE